MDNVIVTGASGFVGSTILNDFADRFGNLVAISRSEIQRVPNPKIKNYLGDVCSDQVRDIIQSNTPTAVIHTAAKSIVRDCEANPHSAFQQNVLGTINILEAVRQTKLDIPVIVFETDKVYGEQPAERIPTKETDVLLGKTPYEYSKVLTANVCDFYRDYYGLKIYSLRPVNIFGFWDRNTTRIIPNNFNKLRNGVNPVVHAGSERQIRQYVYVNDVVEVIIRMLKESPAPGAYNVSPNITKNPFEVIDAIKQVTGINIDTIVEKKNFEFKEILTQKMDGSKLDSTFPDLQYTGFDAALQEMWARMR